MMLGVLQESLIPRPLIGGQLRGDFRPDDGFEGIEARPDVGPERLELGVVARKDGAHGVALRRAAWIA